MSNKVFNIDDLSEVPWRRYSWHGNLVSLDGTTASDFTLEDVSRLIAYGDTDGGPPFKGRGIWDGEVAGIVLLKDGRYVSWESWWGPTGSGFSHDAYGGDADIYFAATEKTARMHLTERARELLVEQP